MNIFNLLNKSQKKIPLNQEEIRWMISSYAKEEIPDYQMSAWLATVFLNELSVEETYHLTQAILDSGEKMSWDFPAVDKHSTGGVGDKTSLIIAPLVASLGYHVPMMSGRGLGHTGGTLDKLESIPGFQTQIDLKKFYQLVSEKKVGLIGQTLEICPADKKLYALRDATHTVANIPLICASIMSKKISEGLNGLVLDVKFGSGAFMSTYEEAYNLAERLLQIAQKYKIKAYAVLSSMQQPLGRFVGNRLEVQECLEIMKEPQAYKETYQDTYELSLVLSALMVLSLDSKYDFDGAYRLCKNKLDSGEVYDFFNEVVKTQGGDLNQVKIEAKVFDVLAENSGIFTYTNTKHLGMAGVLLGAGRKNMQSPIDPSVGYYCEFKNNQEVQKGERLFKVYYNNESQLQEALTELKQGYQIQKTASDIDKPLLIKEILEIKNSKINKVDYERYS